MRLMAKVELPLDHLRVTFLLYIFNGASNWTDSVSLSRFIKTESSIQMCTKIYSHLKDISTTFSTLLSANLSSWYLVFSDFPVKVFLDMGSFLGPLVGLFCNTGLTNIDCVSALWSLGTSTTLGVVSQTAVHGLSSTEATHGLSITGPCTQSFQLVKLELKYVSY